MPIVPTRGDTIGIVPHGRSARREKETTIGIRREPRGCCNGMADGWALTAL